MSADAYLTPLPEWLTRTGTDGRLLHKEYLDIIQQAIDDHPRTKQTEIGPSEIGTPCTRRLAYKLLGQPERQGDGWKPAVGTAIHTWLEDAFDADNLRGSQALDGYERWFIEETVTVGEVCGVPVKGHCDLYDRVTGTVIDHKTTGPTQLTKYRRHGPGAQYRIQAHLYGRGWHLKGMPVERVAIAFLPRNGQLTDSYWWSEPWDEQIALDALERLQGVQLAVTALGEGVLAALGTADNYCTFCPFYKAGSEDLAVGCPGHPGAVRESTSQLAGLLH